MADSDSGSSAKGRSSPRDRDARMDLHFKENDEEDGFLIKDSARVINIYSSRTSHRLDNSKLKFRNLVDYVWDLEHGNGQLIATHMSGKFIAYIVKVSNVGAVRVVDLATNERVLMKGTKGLIKDVEFIHKMDDLVVGFIDQYGTFYIHKIMKDLKSNKMESHLIAQVSCDFNGISSDMRRFIWCKYVADESVIPGSSDDASYHFAVLLDDKVYVSNVGSIVGRFGEGMHEISDVDGMFMIVDAHSGSVMDASFAPDGTALATCSKDGTVKFFQVYLMRNETPRCLYSWAPHDGIPVNKLFFLDDHSFNPSSESQYWKFMVTAAENLTEIKLWTCKTWTCIQTVKFIHANPSMMRMSMDIRSTYLVIADTHRKLLYTLNLEHTDDYARVSWVAEFSLPCNILSLNVIEANVMPTREISAKGYDDYIVSNTRDQVDLCFLDIYFVQMKSLQQGTVAFPCPIHFGKSNGSNRISFSPTSKVHEIAKDDFEEDGLKRNPIPPSPSKLPRPISPARGRSSSKSRSPSPLRNNLDATKKKSLGSDMNSTSRNMKFPSSVTQMTEELSQIIGLSPIQNQSRSRSHSPRSPKTVANSSNSKPTVRVASRNGDMNKTSSSSSPSREVEEILSPKNNKEIANRVSETSPTLEEHLKQLDLDNNILDVQLSMVQPDLPDLHKVEKFLGKKLTSDLMPLHLPEVLEQVNSLMEMMKIQNSEIKELKREVSRLNNTAVVSASRHADEPPITKTLDKYFSQHFNQLHRIEETVKKVESMERQKASVPPPQIPSNLAENVALIVSRFMKTEMESTVVPHILNLFEPTKNHIQVEVEGLIHVTEARIKQDLRTLLQSESFRETLVPEVSTAVKSVCETLVNEHFLRSIIPQFEKALQNVFSQVNSVFLTGTKEYINALENVLDREKKEDHTEVNLKDQFNVLQDHMSSVLQVELESQMLRVISSLQGGLLKQIEETLAHQLHKAFTLQQQFIEVTVPRCMTPAVSVSDHLGRGFVDQAAVVKQLEAMVAKGDIPDAFNQATTINDLAITMKLCKATTPQKVYTAHLPLQTHVSLIQQLASDIQGSTELKISYIQCGIGAIDLGNQKVVQSIAKIIPVFQKSVQKFLAANPESKLIGSIKLLEMALLGIGGQFVQSTNQNSNNPYHALGAYGAIKQEK